MRQRLVTASARLFMAAGLLFSGCAPASTDAPPASAGGERQPSEHPVRRDPARPRPPWLGLRTLPLTEQGYGEIRPTPAVLRDRRFITVDHLPPPSAGRFEARVRRPPHSVLRRSTWSPRCPVRAQDLRYVTVSFWGFDRAPHTGELLVAADAARDLVGVFEKLFEARFPIEEMRITSKRELSAPPTGDGNNTGSFVCRPSRGSDLWSEHAYGLAVDINPFHNPYVRDEVILPELASAYTRRQNRRPGMILPGSVVVDAFDAIGWHWGGEWTSTKDWMHFSRSGS